VGWVPSLFDRLDHQYKKAIRHHHIEGSELSAADILRRNFWFNLMDEPSAMVHVDRIGVDRILFETDFPHSDASWPNSQELFGEHAKLLDEDAVRKIGWENSAKLFRHPVPESIQQDPEAF
jgi:predicted TIM-barrel fold metal-dependent hydrolase